MTRDRDESGRPRNARARDRHGRPLPRGADGEPPADPSVLPAHEALRTADALIADDRPFAAHEVLEAVWKHTTGADRELWRGLAQVAVALTHRARGNHKGAAALFARAAATLQPWTGSTPFGVPVDDVRAFCAAAAAGAHTSAPPSLAGG